jgi:hypothetical protein
MGKNNEMPSGQLGFWGWVIFLAGFSLAASGLIGGLVVAADTLLPAPSQEATGNVLAQRFFSDGPEAYQGTSYFWLARFSLHLSLGVAPSSSHRLEFLWGAKNDFRSALVTVNGRKVEMQAGGYDGFRWQEVPIPKDLGGDSYEIHITAGPGKAGFVAGARLVQVARAPGESPSAAAQEVSAGGQPAFPIPIQLRVDPAEKPQPFGSWRRFWDQPSGRQSLDSGKLTAEEEELFGRAEENARRAHEQFFRCRKYLHGWLAVADSRSGLIPQNLRPDGNVWTPENSAADNYPFMVLSAAVTDRTLFEGRMLEMLEAERRLTNRLDRLPDSWSLATQAFLRSEVVLPRILFGASEYVKDGLLPLTEWLGPSAWSVRLLEIEDDLWKHAPIATPWGNIPSEDVEINGEQLQTLCRIFWMTGQPQYLEWAERLGDYYLLGDHHPTDHLPRLRLLDHGCEVVSGLAELYVTVHFARPEKKEVYRKPLYRMFDRILEVGRDSRGMLYNWINPKTGEHDSGICDTWGYNYNGIYAVYMVDGHEPYRQATRHVLRHLPGLVDFDWGSADQYADSIEGAINLFNREPVPEAAQWIESEIRDLWRPQGENGIIEGWHGDGNVARTGLMYAFWKTQGVTVRPWREDLLVGAVQQAGKLYLMLSAGHEDWKGRLIFDRPRHTEFLHLPIDYPRINQFPEWFVVSSETWYRLRRTDQSEPQVYRGSQLAEGIEVHIPAGREIRWVVEPVDSPSSAQQ